MPSMHLAIDEAMPMAEAALIGCGVMTGVGAALYTAGVPGGAEVAVIGCGGIGMCLADHLFETIQTPGDFVVSRSER